MVLSGIALTSDLCRVIVWIALLSTDSFCCAGRRVTSADLIKQYLPPVQRCVHIGDSFPLTKQKLNAGGFKYIDNSQMAGTPELVVQYVVPEGLGAWYVDIDLDFSNWRLHSCKPIVLTQQL